MQQDMAKQSSKIASKVEYPQAVELMVIEQSEWQWVLIFSSILVSIISLPVIWAFALAQPVEGLFTGVLVNPLDGATYHAKMLLGYEGTWMFELLFTPEGHQGVFLFTFYLALGHLARLLSVPPILIFNLARIVAGILMCLAIYRFIADWTEDIGQRRMTWAIILLAGGFGWLFLPFNLIMPDLLILPEAFPLQAVYANPHFPLAIAAGATIAHVFYKVFFVQVDYRPGPNVETLGLAAATIFLASTSPFVLLPLGAACTVVVLRLWYVTGRFPSIAVEWGLIVVALALPIVGYGLWAVSAANPVFAAWMSQNQTPSPPFWHYLVAFGPVLVLAGTGFYATLRRRIGLTDWFLLGWIIATIILLYAPLGLQRRFALGLILPLSIYAGRGLRRVLLQSVKKRKRPMMLAYAFAAMLPTTILSIILPMLGATQPEVRDQFFIDKERLAMYQWLDANVDDDAVVLAAPRTSLFIPVYAPRTRVVYAHPFETLNAEQREQAVIDFYNGQSCDVLTAEAIDYVVMGAAEAQISGNANACDVPGRVVYESARGEVTVYDLSITQ